MATVTTDIIQHTPDGAADVQTVIGINPDGSSLGAGARAVDGVIETDLIQQPATGGARSVPVVIVVDSNGDPINTGGGGDGGVSTVNGISPDANGNVTIALPIGVPTGGTTGQVVKRTATGIAWGTDNDTTYTRMTQAVADNPEDEAGLLINSVVLNTTINKRIEDAANHPTNGFVTTATFTNGIDGCLPKAEFVAKFMDVTKIPNNAPNIPDEHYVSSIVHHVGRTYEPSFFRVKPFTDNTVSWTNSIPTYSAGGQLKCQDATGNGQAVSMNQFNVRFPPAMRTAINELTMNTQDFTSLAQVSVAIRQIISALHAGRLT